MVINQISDWKIKTIGCKINILGVLSIGDV